jgi:hypothetical protein
MKRMVAAAVLLGSSLLAQDARDAEFQRLMPFAGEA